METGYFYWYWDFLGWLTWVCGACKEEVHRDDVHVTLNWKYCPWCGDKKHESPVKAFDKDTIKMLPKSQQRFVDWDMYK